MRKLYTISLLLFFIIATTTFVSSATYQQNQAIDIRHPVRVGGWISSADCNITVIGPAPNNTIIVQFLGMTDQSSTRGYHNYTLNATQTAQKGEYSYFVTCTNGELNKTESFDFLVNPSGITPSDQRTNAMTRSIYFIFGLGILLFLGFLFTKQKTPVKWTFFATSILFFLIGINIIFTSLSDEIVSPALENFFSGFTAISWYLYWFIAGLLILIWFFTFINTWLFRKNMNNARRYGLG